MRKDTYHARWFYLRKSYLLLEEDSMLLNFKTTTYATLLLIGLFVLPYAGNDTADRLLAF
jgi:hypothetical protein